MDPKELEETARAYREGVRAIDDHVARIRHLVETTAAPAAAASDLHRGVEALVDSMQRAIHDLQGGGLSPGNFLCEMVDQDTLDDFFPKNVKGAMGELRRHVAEAIGDEDLDRILGDTEDVHFVERAREALNRAGLTRLEGQRARAPAVVESLGKQRASAERHLESMLEVPRENAEKFRSRAGSMYALSILPIIGISPPWA